MAAPHRIYTVFDNGKPVALVSAVSQAAAVRHHLGDRFEAVVAEPHELAKLVTDGMRVQTARAALEG